MDKDFEKLMKVIRENYDLIYQNNPNLSEENKRILFDRRMLNLFCNVTADIKTSPEIDKTKPIIYRGLEMSAKEYTRKLKNREFTFFRYGYLGTGNYFSCDREYASGFAGNKDENIVLATLDNDAKKVNIADMLGKVLEFEEYLKKIENDYDPEFINFIAKFAYGDTFISVLASREGYDVISQRDDIQLCVINPEKVTYEYNEK